MSAQERFEELRKAVNTLFWGLWEQYPQSLLICVYIAGLFTTVLIDLVVRANYSKGLR